MPKQQNNIILTGVHMELTEHLRAVAHRKIEKLFKHGNHIISVRIELIHERDRQHTKEYVAKGHVETNGPAIVITVASDTEDKALRELVEKLDRKLSKRARLLRVRRKTLHSVDIPAMLPKVA